MLIVFHNNLSYKESRFWVYATPDQDYFLLYVIFWN